MTILASSFLNGSSFLKVTKTTINSILTKNQADGDK